MDPPTDKKPDTEPHPTTDVEHKMEKIEKVKGGSSFHCDLYDTEVAYKIAQEFIPGLATACVDNTTGGMFKSPATVAVELRREMVTYLTKRSESFVAESVIVSSDPQAEISDHPCDITLGFIDDFTASKRNWLSRVSGWLQSEKREDKVDDFQHQLEKNEFWSMEKREPIAQTLLKNMDLKNKYHCDMKFNSAEELAEHVRSCGFRIMECPSMGCMAKFIVASMEQHDEACPYKVLPCEQKCPVSVMRRDMDKHCITDCPMKIVNCPFYSVGCQAAIPHCTIEQHRLEGLRSHLVFVLQGIYIGASTEDSEKRAQHLEEISSPSELAQCQNARSLTQIVKNLDAKLEPLEVKNMNEEAKKSGEEVNTAAKAVENASIVGKENEEASSENKVSEEVTSTSKASEDASDESKAKVSEESTSTSKASDESKTSEVVNKEAEADEQVNGTSKTGEEVSDEKKTGEEVTATNKVIEDVDQENKVTEEVTATNKVVEDVDNENKVTEEVSSVNNNEEVK